MSKINVLIADDGYVMHQWRKERIWIEAINAEQRTRKNWDETWSFIAEYDQKVSINTIFMFQKLFQN